jgi:hypothetical protein
MVRNKDNSILLHTMLDLLVAYYSMSSIMISVLRRLSRIYIDVRVVNVISHLQ